MPGRLDWPCPLHHLICTELLPLISNPACLCSTKEVHLQSQNGNGICCTEWLYIALCYLLQGVSCFAHSHKLEVLATGSLDHIVRLWTPFFPQHPVACLSSHFAGIVGIVIAERPQYLLSLAQDLVHTLIRVLHTTIHVLSSSHSHCVYGISGSIIYSKQCLLSSPLLSDCQTLAPLLSLSLPSPFPQSQSLATNTLPDSVSDQVMTHHSMVVPH